MNLKKWLEEKTFKNPDKIVELAEPIIAEAMKQSISRKAGNSQNRQQRRNQWTEDDEKGGTENEENNF